MRAKAPVTPDTSAVVPALLSGLSALSHKAAKYQVRARTAAWGNITARKRRSPGG